MISADDAVNKGDVIIEKKVVEEEEDEDDDCKIHQF
jgi:hypothetical protein